jgi:hypothetical protein
MFNKRPEKDVANRLGSNTLKSAGGPGPPPVPNRGLGAGDRGVAGASIIGSDLAISGNLESKGEMQVEGAVQGDC